MKCIVLIFVLLSSVVAPMTDARAAKAAPSVEKESGDVPANQFRSQFQAGMIQGLCRETKFTAECYAMDTVMCEANVKSSIAKCMRDKPPRKEIPKDQVSSYSVDLGKCVGNDFSARNKSRLKRTSECQHPLEWFGR